MGRISRLSEEVVNRIAAGEVVVRPANAVKELLENSLDAGSTEIIVTARNGGLDLIQIQDNGKGIEKEDMSVVCERFTTSKLEKMEDLENISTFGFRGEALASITHVAKVSITSKTTDSSCAYLAHYKDGVLVGDIRPSAGLDGTIITVENLFYNCPARRHALKYPADELNRIADVIVRYAIHNPQISFIFRRCGSGSDFRTNGDGSLRSAVQMLLGSKAASDLIMLDFTNDSLYFSLSGCVARPSASCTALTLQSRQNRQKVFYLFINNRSVECPALKQRLDIVFASKDTLSQFVMLSLKIPANRVDVNVHPTKSVVFFLEQDAIIASVEEYIAKLISDATQSDVNKAVSLGDTFQPPVIIEHLARSDGQFSRKNSQPGAVASVKRRNSVADINISVMDRRQEYAENSSSTTVSRKPQARKLVRTDARERRLEEFAVQGSSQNLSQVETIIVNPSIDNDSDS
ncbi:hypothetical protein AB6A40_010421 [Gnathostoma spinigerum]|uniref:DNA mismatch repair protein S5 domain-containing protein n=1 Tax=Gnathostoma spinigerum TaxID=75299 RepID=A0ABD6EX76_9BILA